MKTIKMGSDGRLEIPFEMWEKIGVRPGDTVELEVSEGCVLLIGNVKADLDDQMGRVIVDEEQNIDEIREEVKKRMWENRRK